MSVSLNPPGNYFDGGANFFVASTDINDFEYRAKFTSVDSAVTGNGTAAHHPREVAVVEDAAELLSSLPLRAVTTRHLPIAAYGPVDRRRINVAREKWSSVSFASDTAAIHFHEELTKDVLALRNAWRKANTKITYPDIVSDEALRYRPPDKRFELGWEMFDAKKHIDVETLDRVALQKANATRAYEYWHSEARSSASPLSRAPSMWHSDSERISRSSTSPLQGPRALHSSPRSGSAGSTSPVRELAQEVDVRRLVTDEQVLQLFHPDEVAAEIEQLKWDFQAFRPPADWKQKHDRRMNALTRKAAEWRPLQLKRQVVEEPTVASRVTSMPAVAPFFTSGLLAIDPKLPVPAAMHGSGVSREVLESHGAHLASAFVVRPEVTQASRLRGGGKAAPTVVEGTSWGDLQRQIAAASQSKT